MTEGEKQWLWAVGVGSVVVHVPTMRVVDRTTWQGASVADENCLPYKEVVSTKIIEIVALLMMMPISENMSVYSNKCINVCIDDEVLFHQSDGTLLRRHYCLIGNFDEYA